MGKTKIEIDTFFKDYTKDLNPNDIENVTYVERSPVVNVATKIKLSGEYVKEYTFLTFAKEISPNRVLVDKNLLVVCLCADIVVIDLNRDEIIVDKYINSYTLYEIYKLKSGYFIWGEGESIFLNDKFEIVWRETCGDIFANLILMNLNKKICEVFDDYITVFDWFGIKHFYNENGEFKNEDYPQYNVDKNYVPDK